jgi:hypothetical protein
MSQSGGAVVKLMVTLLVVLLLATAGLYAYATRQRPLELGTLTPAAANGRPNARDVTLDRRDQIRLATVAHNGGRLPITLEGIGDAARTQPLVVTAIGLGDGTDASQPAAFTPVGLDPGNGVGIVLVIGVNPAFPCERLPRDPTAFVALPPASLRFSTYGVEGTQTLVLDDGPRVLGLTRQACAAGSG